MNHRSRLWATALVMLLPVLAACDGVASLNTPAEAPQFSRDEHGEALVPLEGQLIATRESVQAWIGPRGGRLVLAGDPLKGRRPEHVLLVPAGAVREPTLFQLALASSNRIIVDLSARRLERGRWLDVGHLGFQKPVLLSLSYARTTGRPPKDLTIAYLPADGGPPQALPSFNAAAARQLTGRLLHFSRYAICAN